MYIPSRFVKVVSPLAIAIALTACGGGSSFGGGSNSGGTTNPDNGGRPAETVAVSSIDLNADSLQLLSDGSKPVSITAVAKGEDGVAINDAEFKFSVDSNATLVVSGGTATLTPGSAKIGDVVTVTVQSGDKTDTIEITVVEKEAEVVQGGVTVAAIDVRADSTKLFVDGTRPVKITAITKNALNNVISAEVDFATTDNATLAVSGNTVTVTPDGALAGETITIKITAGDIDKEVILTVTEQETVVEGGETVDSIVLRADTQKLLADGSKSVSITATPLNAKNIAIDAEVAFSAVGNAILEVSGNTVLVTSNSATVGQTVTITAKSGGEENTISLDVIEKEADGEVVDSIDFRADSLELLLDGSKPITFTATLKNADNIAISAEVVYRLEGKGILIVNGNTATLTPDQDAAENDTVTVFVKSGELPEKSIPIQLVKNTDESQGGGETVTSLDLRTDSDQLLFDGSKSIKITAVPKNSDNNAISAGVSFSTTSETATLVVSGNTATLTSDNAQPGEIIIVNVKAGDLAPEPLSFTVVDVEQAPVLHLEPMIVGLSTLSAGGSTGITLELKDQNGDFAKTPHTAVFSSACISNGSSEIESPIESSTGVFTTTYTAKGCEGEDVITATVDGLKTTTTIDVTPANLGAVEFVSSEPKNILLKGMSAPGMQHTSKVTFLIKNDAGGPIANADVAFELVTNGAGDGGIELATLTGKTNNDGIVSVILESGSVHTSVRVRATVEREDTTISSESSSLVISTGVADQNSLSLSLETLNPAAWNHDGVEVSVNMIASDRYNNPVPDGTTVSFYTELGQIDPSCETTNGRCSVKWTSSDPRVLGITDTGYADDGITTITAKVIGEESFLDTNANGIFDEGDVFDTNSDRGEAYADYNRGYSASQGYDDGLDRFILDYNGDGVRNLKDGKYTGLGCVGTQTVPCADDNGLKDIFTSVELVMSEDSQAIKVFTWNVQLNQWDLVFDSQNGGMQENPLLAGQTGDTRYRLHNNKNYWVEVFGSRNRQVPPVGTSITSNSEAAEVIVGSATVPNTNNHGNDVTNPYGAYGMPLYLEASEEKSTGTVTIKVNANSLESSYVLPYELFIDTDNDGIPNAQDLDDDGDGVLDENDAFPLDSTETVDTDGDGIGDNADTDDDGDGVLDINDAFPFNAAESLDTDGDGTGNNADTDDDGDGVLDATDAFPLDATETVDTDGDGIGNNADTDDDGDSVLDATDAFPLDATETVDTDGDAIGNNVDTDDDDDGVLDVNDAFPLDASESLDTDVDGTGNNADTDDDNDGILDATDAHPLDTDNDGTINANDIDDDNDGVSDAQDLYSLDHTESTDTDGDGVGNNADTDDDNDGVLDINDAFPLDNTEAIDSDFDGVGNNADPDDDNDGILDVDELENGGSANTDTDSDGIIDTIDTDDDNDGIPDATDALPLDTDNDGIDNVDDIDDDNDGVHDNLDRYPLNQSEAFDTDNDGLANNADADDDGDGVLDGADAFPLDDGESIDTDSDGVGNNNDLDDDNDGIADVDEIANGTDPLDALSN